MTASPQPAEDRSRPGGPLVFRTLAEGWLSNSWLVADRPRGHAVVIDTGGPWAPIEARIEELGLTVTHVLCTHHHPDHVAHNAEYQARHGCPVCGHAAERELFGHLDHELADGDEVRSGALTIRAMHVPGHTVGQLSFLVDEREVFTGDTLFRGSVGGTRGRGHTTAEDLQQSIMDRLLVLPETTVIRPGHMNESSVARELAENPFVAFWQRGETNGGGRRVTALGTPAELLVEARDYDGGTKCLVRYDDGLLDVVPGSRISGSE